ncbi:MAG: histidine kinase dimerization/phospho-acceptor domain-containing protein [Gammaproteobacteria bacterium]|nr:histidine kinase dimerization/phospho-acceptor domain-containing protein [Gammaproteobacteria bacterium]
MTFKLLHLATFAAISVVLAGIGGVAVTYLVVEEEVRDLIDDDLEAQAEFFAALISDQRISMSRQTVQSLIDEAFEPDPDDVGDIQEMLWITVYDRTSGAHISNLKHELPLAQPGSGSITRELLGHEWYGHQHDQSGGPIVQLLHHSDRWRDSGGSSRRCLLPAIAVVGVNVTLLAGLVYLSLWPMTRLARQIEQRPAASSYPVELSTPAREVAVLRDALNGYIRAVDEVLIREREFASDVAHELRTPLTTLRLELSSASVDMESMQSEVERMIALVSQLLTLARLERSSWREASEPVPLHVVIGDLWLLWRRSLLTGIFP